MAKLTTKARAALPAKSFALPGKGSGPSGKGSGSYPINNPSHARAALAMSANYATPVQKTEIRSKVAAKYPNIAQKGAKKK